MTVSLVGHAFTDPGNNSSTQTLLFNFAVNANDLICLWIPWGGGTTTFTGVTDTSGNAYQSATGPTSFNANAGITSTIYYAYRIKAAGANTNTLTATWPTARNFGAIMAAVFRSTKGGFMTNPLVTAPTGTQGAGTAASVTINPSVAGFIFSGVGSPNAVTAAGTGYSIADGPTAVDGYLSQYKLASSAGSQTVTATTSGGFCIQAAAFKEPNLLDVMAWGTEI